MCCKASHLGVLQLQSCHAQLCFKLPNRCLQPCGKCSGIFRSRLLCLGCFLGCLQCRLGMGSVCYCSGCVLWKVVAEKVGNVLQVATYPAAAVQ